MLWRLEEVFGSAGSMQLWVLALWGWSVEVISPVSWTWESLQLSITPSQSAEHRQRVLLSLVAGGLQVMVPIAEPCLWLLPGLWARGRSSGNNWELGGFFFFLALTSFMTLGKSHCFWGLFFLDYNFWVPFQFQKKLEFSPLLIIALETSVLCLHLPCCAIVCELLSVNARFPCQLGTFQGMEAVLLI